jgi:uncharacterized membrane protein
VPDVGSRSEHALYPEIAGTYAPRDRVEGGAPVSFEEVMEDVVRGFEVAGVAILAIGSIFAGIRFLLGLVGARRAEAYQRVRNDIGRAILLGLEVLIIADIVQTITLDPTIEGALTLGIVVLVRTFLSFSLEIELEGVVPWRRRAVARSREP